MAWILPNIFKWTVYVNAAIIKRLNNADNAEFSF